jgi:hypothetical protein
MELHPCYVETIIRGWQRFTGLDAAHQNSEQTFVSVRERGRGCLNVITTPHKTLDSADHRSTVVSKRVGLATLKAGRKVGVA